MKKWIVVLLLLKGFSGFTQQVVVANTRQNIVYCGVQNPLIALATGYPCGSVVLTTKNGKIEKSGCYFTYQPAEIGITKINVWVRQGRSLRLKGYAMYRAKSLPLPITLIGNSRGGYISLSVLKAQGGIRAYIPDSDFDASVTVTGYTAAAIRDTTPLFRYENAGAVYNDALVKNLDTLKAGDLFIVSDIRCKGPDEKEVKPGPMEFYIKS